MSLILFFCFLVWIIFNIKPFCIEFDVNYYYNTKLDTFNLIFHRGSQAFISA